MRTAILVLSILLATACNAPCNPSTDSPDQIDCTTLRFDSEGKRVVAALGVGTSPTCTASVTDATVTLQVSGALCGGNHGNRPVINTYTTNCTLPPLDAGTYALLPGATLIIPDDGGVGSCAR